MKKYMEEMWIGLLLALGLICAFELIIYCIG